ncbi:polysaccharide biosynthesis/export family protein [Nitrospira sp. NS4]|uniref:polysaccharide biosynthesis/export family protein n=1 Tax=Nitrospira sp. NS4 TaxID=3414498 RepID=UPI003C2D0708
MTLSLRIGLLCLFACLMLGLESGCLGTTPVQGAVETGAEPTYLLGPEDVLKISVWKDEQLTQETVVRPDGMITFPLIGEVTAAGRTVEEVRSDIAKRLVKFIPTPNVTVTVLKVLSYRIYVLGRVNKPGEFLVGHHTDVLQALSLAGGLTPYASENDIKIMRRGGGDQQVFRFRYGDVQKGKDLKQNLLLQRGDVVMVP